MFNFKTKRYYKNSLKIQMSNNKMINEHLMKEKKYSQELSKINNNLIKEYNEINQQLIDIKKEKSVLKGKLTKLTNELNKQKIDNTKTIPEETMRILTLGEKSSKSILEKIKKGEI